MVFEKVRPTVYMLVWRISTHTNTHTHKRFSSPDLIELNRISNLTFDIKSLYGKDTIACLSCKVIRLFFWVHRTIDVSMRAQQWWINLAIFFQIPKCSNSNVLDLIILKDKLRVLDQTLNPLISRSDCKFSSLTTTHFLVN